VEVVVCSVVVIGVADNVNIAMALFVPAAVICGVALKYSMPYPALMEDAAPLTQLAPLYFRISSTTGLAIVTSDRLSRGIATSAEPLKLTPAMFLDVVSVAAEPVVF